LEGKTLADVIANSYRYHGESPDIESCLSWISEIASALEFCHKNGVVHRDIKPENILIESGSNRAVLLDFGLVKQDHESVEIDILGFSQNLSQSGAVYGTPAYMSPEQLDSSEYGFVGAKSDVWSLAATLFFCLTNEQPYPDLGFAELISHRVKHSPRNPRKLNSEIPKWLDNIISKALSVDFKQRPSMEEFATGLTDIPKESASLPLVSGILIAVMLLTIGAVAFTFHTHQKELEQLSPKAGPISKTAPKKNSKPNSKTDAAPSRVDKQVEKKPPPAPNGGGIKANQKVSIEPLADTHTWKACSKDLQDRILSSLKTRLSAFEFLGAKEYRCHTQMYRIGRYKHRKTGMIMHLVPGGRHQLKMSGKSYDLRVSPFLISQTEVKQKSWDTVDSVGGGGKDALMWKGPDLPIHMVSWNTTNEWLQSVGMRLPWENEWIWAYRAGTDSRYFWGDVPDDQYFWSSKNSTQVRNSSEHLNQSNAFGLIDMAGNLSEFVGDPVTVKMDEDHPHKTWPFRLIKGGSWRYGASRVRYESRIPTIQQGRSKSIGFRAIYPIPGFPESKSVAFNNEFDFRRKAIDSSLDVLYDRKRWNKGSESLQNKALSVVVKQLAPAYKYLGAKSYVCGGQSHRIATFIHEKTKIKFRLIPGGHVLMGDSSLKYSKPATPVPIPPFLISRFPLRQFEWDAIGGADERKYTVSHYPIHKVSFHDVTAWLTKAGDGMRLPSESEWEYAARSGTKTRFYWGDVMNDEHCFYAKNTNKRIRPPTEHKEQWNAFGLSDMTGNVWEWCADVWSPTHRNNPRNGRPRTGAAQLPRVVRGNSAVDALEAFHIAERRAYLPDRRLTIVGVRVVRDLTEIKGGH
jgi:formylglycine-generating enzyme required for sulfatase activity/serine/threonine protein kinase